MGIRNSKEAQLNWILWWRLDAHELQHQVAEYDSLGLRESARGASALMLTASAGVVILLQSLRWVSDWTLVDAALLLGLTVFVFQGRRWAMVSAMIYWTIAKGDQILHWAQLPSPGRMGPNPIVTIIWWTMYMHALYKAYRVEKVRRAAVPVADSAQVYGRPADNTPPV